jgi:hypothetical protein
VAVAAAPQAASSKLVTVSNPMRENKRLDILTPPYKSQLDVTVAETSGEWSRHPPPFE